MLNGGGVRREVDARGQSLSWGVGIAQRIAEKVDVRFDWEFYELDGEHLDFATVNFVFPLQ